MKIKLKAQKPYNFDLSCMVFSDGDPQIRKYDEGEFWQVLNVNNELILINVKSSENADEPELSIELKSDEDIFDEDIEIFLNLRTRFFLIRPRILTVAVC